MCCLRRVVCCHAELFYRQVPLAHQTNKQTNAQANYEAERRMLEDELEDVERERDEQVQRPY